MRSGRAGQGRAGQGRAGQGRAGQGRAGQGRAGQGRAGQGRAGQGRAGQGSRIRDNRWKPFERERPRGRPARRWRDELDDYWKGTIWHRTAQDGQMWKQDAEAFAQPRDTMIAK